MRRRQVASQIPAGRERGARSRAAGIGRGLGPGAGLRPAVGLRGGGCRTAGRDCPAVTHCPALLPALLRATMTGSLFKANFWVSRRGGRQIAGWGPPAGDHPGPRAELGARVRPPGGTARAHGAPPGPLRRPPAAARPRVPGPLAPAPPPARVLPRTSVAGAPESRDIQLSPHR